MKSTNNSFLCATILALVMIQFGCIITFPTNFPRDNSIDPQLYIPSFAPILGEGWYDDQILIATISDDFKGRPTSLVYRAEQSTYNLDNTFSAITYTILIYSDTGSALERYNIQRDTLFFDDPRDSYEWQTISTASLSHSDNSHVACIDVPSENIGRLYRCMGIFLYGRSIAVIRTTPIANDVQYFPDDLMPDLLQVIDQTLAD